MTSNCLIGPYCFDGPVNIAAYSAIMQTWLKPQLRHRGHTDGVWLQQDGAHTHTLHSFVHDVVSKHFPGCLIGCGSMTSLAPLTCPPLLLFQPTNAQICITTVSPYIMFSPAWFDISVILREFYICARLPACPPACLPARPPACPPACLTMLHKFLKLKLLKLKFHKMITLKYIKILFGHRLVIQ